MGGLVTFVCSKVSTHLGAAITTLRALKVIQPGKIVLQNCSHQNVTWIHKVLPVNSLPQKPFVPRGSVSLDVRSLKLQDVKLPVEYNDDGPN